MEGAGSWRRLQQRELLGEDEALAAHALDVDGHERAELHQLLAQRVAPRSLRGDAVERGAAGAEQAMGAVPGQELVPELFSRRHLVGEQLGREQPFEEVVVPAVALAPGQADRTRDGVRLEHGAHDVLRHPEPVLRCSVLGLEIERRQRAFRTDPPEHAVGHHGVLGENPGVEPGPLAAEAQTEPGELARQDERQRLIGRLEDLTAFVEQIAPGGLVAGDSRVQHEVVVPAGDRDRVELDRPELPDDLDYPAGASRDRACGREKMPRDKEATRRPSSDFHPEDTSRTAWRAPRSRWAPGGIQGGVTSCRSAPPGLSVQLASARLASARLASARLASARLARTVAPRSVRTK